MKLRIGWHTMQQIDNNASNILFVRREVFFKKSILFIKQHSLNYILGMYLEMLQNTCIFTYLLVKKPLHVVITGSCRTFKKAVVGEMACIVQLAVFGVVLFLVVERQTSTVVFTQQVALNWA